MGPDFIGIGAQKAGTEWLYDQLSHHPQFWMPPVKELHYFGGGTQGFRRAKSLKIALRNGLDAENILRKADNSKLLTRRDVEFVDKILKISGSDRTVSAYAELFSGKGQKLSGDITPTYDSLDDHTIKQIVDYLPGIKIVFLARDPIERFWSNVNMLLRKQKLPGATLKVILDFAASEPSRARSFPSLTVSRWRRHVPEGQFGLFFFDDLRDAPGEFRRQLLLFLGADPLLQSGDLDPGFNRKSEKQKIPMPGEIYESLVAEFAGELDACAEVLGGRAVEWRRKHIKVG